ncbi:GNAT family N-acetyltransferase [Lentibacillus sp. N15]|uniref:GNAT family N-acetyltransferase n=1 Tax=Lentibacillus songyuanensis TaxID=3136161 RepID=UPI0031BA879B
MEIRKLKENDVEQYLELRLESLQKNPEAFATSYEEEKEQPVELYKNRLKEQGLSITFGAFENSQLIGIITIVRENKQKLIHRANIVSTYVIPQKRGCGIGKKLLVQAMKEAQSMEGIEQLYLTVASKNQVAKHLYKSVGFDCFGTDRKALKFQHAYVDVDHMVLYF